MQSGRANHLLKCYLCLLVLDAVLASPAVPHQDILEKIIYDPNNIVTDATGPECSVTNVFFDKQKEFDYESVFQFGPVLRDGNISQDCYRAGTDLAVCYTDRSFSIKFGCCSKACAAAFAKSVETGCNKEYRLAACLDPRGYPLVLAGDVMLKRCTNYTELNCEEAIAAQLRPGVTKPEAVQLERPQATKGKAAAENVTAAPQTSSNGSSSSSSTCCHAGGSLMTVAAALLSFAAVWLPLQ